MRRCTKIDKYEVWEMKGSLSDLLPIRWTFMSQSFGIPWPRTSSVCLRDCKRMSGSNAGWCQGDAQWCRVMGKVDSIFPPSRVCRRLWGQPNSHEATIGQIAFFPPLRPAQIVKYHVRATNTSEDQLSKRYRKVKYKWGSSPTLHWQKISVYLSFDHS